MKFDFSADEINVLLMSLIQRRANVMGLLNDSKNASESYVLSYRAELTTVENLLEKFFPGSVERIKASQAA